MILVLIALLAAFVVVLFFLVTLHVRLERAEHEIYELRSRLTPLERRANLRRTVRKTGPSVA